MDMEVFKKVKEVIKNAPKDPNVSYREIVVAIHAIAVHKFGAEAVGDLYEYLTRPPGYWNNFERCLESARKYKSRLEWRKNESGAYYAAQNNGWFSECVKHMGDGQNPKGYWTFERCLESARRHEIRERWKKNESGACTAARKNGWYFECVQHMGDATKPRGYWSKENCIKSALRFSTREDWRKNESAAYGAARNGGFLDECCAHMKSKTKPANYWTKDRCIAEASRFQSRNEWANKSISSYNASRKNGWLDEACAHMTSKINPNNYWTKQRCLEEALKHSSKYYWQKKSGSSYGKSLKEGWVNECCAHMKSERKPDGYWTKSRCVEEASKYQSKSDWRKKSSSSYSISLKNGWHKECCAHMQPNT